MQGPEDFCRKIDLKLRRSIILTLAVVFAGACAASLIMFLFALDDDFMLEKFSGENIGSGHCTEFLLSSAQSDGTAEFSSVSSELSNGVFSAVICGKNYGDCDIIIRPADVRFYATDVQNCKKPRLCCVNIDEDVVIKPGSESVFSFSVNLPQDFSFDGCKASAVISDDANGNSFGIMLN